MEIIDSRKYVWTRQEKMDNLSKYFDDMKLIGREHAIRDMISFCYFGRSIDDKDWVSDQLDYHWKSFYEVYPSFDCLPERIIDQIVSRYEHLNDIFGWW